MAGLPWGGRVCVIDPNCGQSFPDMGGISSVDPDPAPPLMEAEEPIPVGKCRPPSLDAGDQ